MQYVDIKSIICYRKEVIEQSRDFSCEKGHCQKGRDKRGRKEFLMRGKKKF